MGTSEVFRNHILKILKTSLKKMKPNENRIGMRTQSSANPQACFPHDSTQSIFLRFMYILMYVYMPCLLLFMGRRNVDVEARRGCCILWNCESPGMGAGARDQREGLGKSREHWPTGPSLQAPNHCQARQKAIGTGESG